MNKSNKLGKLAIELQKYYSRKGNRIVFANGMSLNQLSLAMWERLGYKEVDASVLSRVLKGDRLLTPRQLKVFCNILKLKRNETKHMIYALGLDISKRFGIPMQLIYGDTDAVVSIVESDLKVIETTKRTTPFIHTSEWLKQLIFQVDRLQYLVNEKQRIKLLSLKAELLMHYVWILPSITCNWNTNSKARHLKNELNNLSEYLKRSDLSEKGKVLTHQIKYFTGDYGRVCDIVESTDFSLLNDIEYEADLLRAVLVCYVKTKKVDDFDRAKRWSLKRMKYFNNDLKAKIHQGIAVSESRLGHYSESRKNLDKAWYYYEESRKYPDHHINRMLQLVNTELEIALDSRSKNVNYLEKLGNDGLLLSQYIGHSYYGKEINNRMNILFNS